MAGSAVSLLEPHHRSIQMPLPFVGSALLCDAARAAGAPFRNPVFRDDDGVDAWVSAESACGHAVHLPFRLGNC